MLIDRRHNRRPFPAQRVLVLCLGVCTVVTVIGVVRAYTETIGTALVVAAAIPAIIGTAITDKLVVAQLRTNRKAGRID